MQKSRWCKGGMQIFFSHHNAIFHKNISFMQKILWNTSGLAYISATVTTPVFLVRTAVAQGNWKSWLQNDVGRHLVLPAMLSSAHGWAELSSCNYEVWSRCIQAQTERWLCTTHAGQNMLDLACRRNPPWSHTRPACLAAACNTHSQGDFHRFH